MGEEGGGRAVVEEALAPLSNAALREAEVDDFLLPGDPLAAEAERFGGMPRVFLAMCCSMFPKSELSEGGRGGNPGASAAR